MPQKAHFTMIMKSKQIHFVHTNANDIQIQFTLTLNYNFVFYLPYCSPIHEGYEELVAPDFIETVTAPNLKTDAFNDPKFQRTPTQRKDLNLPFDASHSGKPNKCLHVCNHKMILIIQMN